MFKKKLDECSAITKSREDIKFFQVYCCSLLQLNKKFNISLCQRTLIWLAIFWKRNRLFVNHGNSLRVGSTVAFYWKATFPLTVFWILSLFFQNFAVIKTPVWISVIYDETMRNDKVRIMAIMRWNQFYNWFIKSHLP